MQSLPSCALKSFIALCKYQNTGGTHPEGFFGGQFSPDTLNFPGGVICPATPQDEDIKGFLQPQFKTPPPCPPFPARFSYPSLYSSRTTTQMRLPLLFPMAGGSASQRDPELPQKRHLPSITPLLQLPKLGTKSCWFLGIFCHQFPHHMHPCSIVSCSSGAPDGPSWCGRQWSRKTRVFPSRIQAWDSRVLGWE